MKATELRIGNLVNDEDMQPMYIAGLWPTISKDIFIDSAGNTENCDILTGIPLTVEWLVKFGFEIDTWHSPAYHKNGMPFLLTDNESCFTVWNSNYDDEIICTIEHVHQLQNLYFALTGNILT